MRFLDLHQWMGIGWIWVGWDLLQGRTKCNFHSPISAQLVFSPKPTTTTKIPQLSHTASKIQFIQLSPPPLEPLLQPPTSNLSCPLPSPPTDLHLDKISLAIVPPIPKFYQTPTLQTSLQAIPPASSTFLPHPTVSRHSQVSLATIPPTRKFPQTPTSQTCLSAIFKDKKQSSITEGMFE